MGDRRAIDPPPYRRDYDLRIILEIPSEVLGFVLWRSWTKLLLWFGTPEQRRSELYLPGTGRARRMYNQFTREAREAEPRLAEALEWLDLFARCPQAVAAPILADACRRVALWAEGGEFTETSLRFAEVAALADDEHPRLANLAGRLARNAAEFDRAELWFARAIGLARSKRNWIEYTRGHIGLGILWQTLGNDRRARRCFATAASRAMRDGREWLAAEAQHDLMLMATERGMFPEAEECGRRALAWYPKNHERLPYLVADVAFLLVSEQQHERAVGLLIRFFRVVKESGRQVLALSVLARALGGIGDHRFFRVRRRLLRRLERYRECEAAARVNLGEGERAAGMWQEAVENARIAVAIAERTRDSAPERLGRQLLAAATAHMPPETPPSVNESSLTTLVSVAIERLDEWLPSQRGRRARSSGGDSWAVA